MKNKSSQISLDAISKLLDQKLGKFEEKINIRFEKLENKFDSLENKVDSNFLVTHEMIKQLRKEMNQRFDQNDQAHKEIIKQNEQDHAEIIDILREFVDGIYTSVDNRITKLEHKVFAS